MTAEERAKQYHLNRWNSLVDDNLKELPEGYDISDTVAMLNEHAIEMREKCRAVAYSTYPDYVNVCWKIMNIGV